MEVPAKLLVDERYAGKEALVRPQVRHFGVMCPTYLATVDEQGRLPLLLSNVKCRTTRIQPWELDCDVEFEPTFLAGIALEVDKAKASTTQTTPERDKDAGVLHAELRPSPALSPG